MMDILANAELGGQVAVAAEVVIVRPDTVDLIYKKSYTCIFNFLSIRRIRLVRGLVNFVPALA